MSAVEWAVVAVFELGAACIILRGYRQGRIAYAHILSKPLDAERAKHPGAFWAVLALYTVMLASAPMVLATDFR